MYKTTFITCRTFHETLVITYTAGYRCHAVFYCSGHWLGSAIVLIMIITVVNPPGIVILIIVPLSRLMILC